MVENVKKNAYQGHEKIKAGEKIALNFSYIPVRKNEFT